jgi:hypothetical protein
MGCCDRCADVRRCSYEVTGDGDGVEFLIETAHLRDGGRRASTVVFCASGVGERRGDAATRRGLPAEPGTPPGVDG